MIYTVTFNPAIDYVIGMNELSLGSVNRADVERLNVGGKGINVSVLLSNLGIGNSALGFIAGFTGDAIEQGLKRMGVNTSFIRLKEGASRINVKIKASEETEINGRGPDIPDEAIEELFKMIDKIDDGDYLVLAGSIPSSMPDDIYEKIMERVQQKDVKVVVDATKNLLLNVVKYRPFLVKPNKQELAQMFDVVIENDSDVIMYGKKLQQMGARNVLVSMAGDGAILIDENGSCTKNVPAKGKVLNSVGAGDSMVAGFIAGYMESGDYSYALKLGSAAGSATAFSYGIATKEDIEKVKEVLL